MAPTLKGGRPRARRRRDHTRRDGAVGVDHGRRAFGQQIAEQPQLGGEVILFRRVVIHVVARQVGEAGGGEPDAVEALLVEPVRGGLHRQMGDAVRRQPRQSLMQRDRIGRRQRAIDRQRARDDADGAERGGLEPNRPQIWRTKAATEVLPLVPVTATIVAGRRG